ncbi:DUF397 domain-containing protein [Actinokineospora auranticolor]|uniref:Uncharacterized protein DUF397 n=1 Tax=Actinokineospora auranticolor TaxID=155976 RepID=A0A2S6GZB5_9PSEU|nr:DUF397 domain-containing protein [Actinokineospora auranticolor]PPK70592.1 uncharacterized protein DUF397 [Actinokineospora auranticolor]
MSDSPVQGWRKSSRSGSNGCQCVELHSGGAIRDSKNPGPTLRADISALVRLAKRS